jgi:hypothetical protein
MLFGTVGTVIQYILLGTLSTVICYTDGLKISENSKIIKNQIVTKSIFDDIYKMAILSKSIYDYDFNNKINEFKNKRDSLCILSKWNRKNNLSIDTIKSNNIYFNTDQHVSLLNIDNFSKEAKSYLNLISNNFNGTEIYGYFNNKNRLHSLIIINHKLEEINIVFRGSMYLDEWISNLMIKENDIPYSNFKIHSGILNLYKNSNINNHTLYILKNLFEYFPKYKKIFGAHSKGTILSFLTIIELLFKLDNKNDNYEIICFGNPQILNKELANFLHKHTNIKIYNVINENDIISHLPFNNKYQIGIEILLKDNDMIVNKHKEPYQRRINIFSNFCKSIKNHDLKEYINKLNKLSNYQ